MALEKLQVILELITGQYKREAREAATVTGQIGSAATSATGPVGSLAQRGGDLTKAYKGFVAVAAGAAIVRFASDSVTAASDLGESVNAVNKVFGDASGVIENFGQVSANAVGLSTREFNQLATVTGSMLTNLGLNAQAAAGETITLTQRAADMASVFNTDVGTALDAINSALKGEANPIEQFGVKLNDAAVRARAVELGLAATTAAVDANGKATATLSLIYEQTSKTQGDFAGTSDDLANAQRRAAAAMENAQARFGKAVTPALANLMDRLAEGMERVAAVLGDEGAKKSIVFNEAMMGINKAMAEGTLGAEDLADSLLHIALNSDLTATDFQTLAGAVGLSQDQWAIFSADVIAQAKEMGLAPEVIAEMEEAMTDVTVAAPIAAGAIDGMVPAVDRLTTAQRLAGEATRIHFDQLVTLADFLAAQINPVLAAHRAITALADAQKIAEDAARDHGRESEEFALAMIEVALKAAEAEGALGTFGANAPASIDAVAEALGISNTAAQTLLETLGLLDGMTVTTTLISRQVNLLEEGVIPEGMGLPRSGSGRSSGRAFGGSVSAGRPYLVGERGPEMMVPNQSGTILPNGWNRPNSTIVIQSPMNDFAQDLQLATILATVNTMVEVQG